MDVLFNNMIFDFNSFHYLIIADTNSIITKIFPGSGSKRCLHCFAPPGPKPRPAPPGPGSKYFPGSWPRRGRDQNIFTGPWHRSGRGHKTGSGFWPRLLRSQETGSGVWPLLLLGHKTGFGVWPRLLRGHKTGPGPGLKRGWPRDPVLTLFINIPGSVP